jgi:hypothetical protein
MKDLTISKIRAGHPAWSILLSTILLITLLTQSYSKSYAMSIETDLTESTEVLGEIVEEIAIADEELVVEVEKTEYEIPSTYVHPKTGNLMAYNGGKTLERTSRITYGEAGVINRLATPDQDGFMKLDNRYLIAVGSRFQTSIGQYIDLVLANGVVIPCIMGDLKADQDTDLTHTFTYHSACCSEFIIDEHTIRSDIYERGNASLKNAVWDSPVVSVIVYDDYYEEA